LHHDFLHAEEGALEKHPGAQHALRVQVPHRGDAKLRFEQVRESRRRQVERRGQCGHGQRLGQPDLDFPCGPRDSGVHIVLRP
jgi:hypothetical protein